jgi:hypothetical protein
MDCSGARVSRLPVRGLKSPRSSNPPNPSALQLLRWALVGCSPSGSECDDPLASKLDQGDLGNAWAPHATDMLSVDFAPVEVIESAQNV